VDIAEEDLETLHRRYANEPTPAVATQLLMRYEPLASNLARRFAHRNDALEDARQTALMGLLSALNRFDPDYGAPFLTYAIPTIMGALKRHLRDQTWLVKPTRHVQDVYLEVNRNFDELEQDLGRSPTMQELADHSGIPVEEIADGVRAGNGRFATARLEPASWDHEDASTDAAFGEDDHNVIDFENRAEVISLLRSLRDIEREVLVLTYFDDIPQRQIANRLGVSQVHVSRIKHRALKRLRALNDAPTTLAS
jgi:RNA polymerase sigma-B factor